jgi:uncharacterized YccA/Bax inhibitor family protein
MNMFEKSSNPVLKNDTFDSFAFTGTQSESMTIRGTVNKTILMLMIVVLGATYTWKIFFDAPDQVTGASKILGWMIGGAIGGFVVSLVTIFKKSWAAYTVPVYAILEGLFLGAISAFFNARFPGIVIQAVSLTFGTLFALLFAYKTGLIKATEKFKLGVIAATGGIAIFYFISFIISMFGVNMSIVWGNGLFSIGLSVFIVIIAALNLVLDFDFIEKGAMTGAPKYMEWFGAFSLLVTLIWLYIEFLRLLSKISSRD